MAYDFHEIPELPGSSLISAGEVISIEGIDAKIENTRTSIETALLDSRIAPVFVNILEITPDNALGIIPSDYMTAIEIGRATSELQSPMYLVCRLLLEKKKQFYSHGEV